MTASAQVTTAFEPRPTHGPGSSIPCEPGTPWGLGASGCVSVSELTPGPSHGPNHAPNHALNRGALLLTPSDLLFYRLPSVVGALLVWPLTVIGAGQQGGREIDR